ncbi:hypothetical protein GCM10007981_08860 [Thermocladium modestius]|uniref:Uncharacterized protein n=1 Tax=Thermocladium modestius TaxID=62609 RepID=A0A830GUI4_9CREN|nr:hypothetical protein [Thermocladium modestius]GGP20505.1 hypothetical protein GCM10007981_08860 [Thermocladium modestius]
MDSLKLAVAEVGLKRIYVEVLPDDELFVVCECRRRRLTKPVRYALGQLLQRLHYMKPRVKLVMGARIVEIKPYVHAKRGKYIDAASSLGRLSCDFHGVLAVVDANAIYIGKLLREAERIGAIKGMDIMIISDPRPDSDIAAMAINMAKKYGRVILITHDKWFAQLRGIDVIILNNKGLNSATIAELIDKLEMALV